jgi:hypothetical protein
MKLSGEQAARTRREYERVAAHLRELPLELLYRVRPKLTSERAQEYFSQGIGRRLGLIVRCLENVFRIFPPERTVLLSREELTDVQINLHAYVINIYGILDNIAWTYVLEKGVQDSIKSGRAGVGLFAKQTQEHLPDRLVAYLSTLSEWFNDYAKNYRDALAHRIPLYVPPFSVTNGNEAKYRDLERQIWERIVAHDFEAVDRLKDEQASLGTVCAVYIHSYSDADASGPVALHPQMICDAMTVIQLLEQITRDLTGEVTRPFSFNEDKGKPGKGE